MNKKTLTKIIAPFAVIVALTYPAKEAYEFHNTMSNLGVASGTAVVVDECLNEGFARLNTEYGKAYMNQSPEFAGYDIQKSKSFKTENE